MYISILVTAAELFFPCFVFATDISDWSYTDLRDTARDFKADGNYDDALKFFDKAVNAAPQNAEAYLNRGGMLAILNQNAKALQDEKQALELAKGNSYRDSMIRSLAHENLSALYLNMKRFSESELEAQAAVKACPDSPTASTTFGNILMETKKYPAALRSYLKAKSLFEHEGSLKEVKEINKKIDLLKAKSTLHR